MAIAGYNIYVGGVKKNTALITGLTYNVTELLAGSTNTVQVKAVDGAGNEGPASPASFLTKPGTVTGVTGAAQDANSIALGWTALTGAASYKIEHKLISGSTWTAATSGTTGLTITGLTASTSYDFRVKGTNATGDSLAWSTVFTLATTGTVNTTPAAPTVTADDSANWVKFTHALGNAEIVVSVNDGAYGAMTSVAGWDSANSRINVGDVARPLGYWKARTKAAAGRNESPVTNSPLFTTQYTLLLQSGEYQSAGLSSGADVTQWKDLSGNTNHMSNTAAATSNPVVSSSGGILLGDGDSIVSTAPWAPPGDVVTQLSVIAKVHVSDLPAGNKNQLLIGSTRFSGTNRAWAIYAQQNVNNPGQYMIHFQISQDGGPTNQKVWQIPHVELATRGIDVTLAFTFDAGVFRVYRNGTEYVDGSGNPFYSKTINATVNSIHNNQLPVRMGHQVTDTGTLDTGWDGFRGSIRKVVIMRSVATGSQLTL